MITEPVKTGVMVALALITSITALLYMPQSIVLEDQARVNEPLFTPFETSEVRVMQIQGLTDPSANLSKGQSGPTQLTMRLSNKGWSIDEYEDYPAGNNKLIGELAAIMGDLKVVEVLSEDPTELELREYGLDEPDGQNENLAEVGVRLAIMDGTNTKLAEIIVGKQATTANQKSDSYYVRSTLEPGIFRVQIDKRKLDPSLVNWVDSNVLEVRVPEGMPVVNPGYRSMEEIMVATSPYADNAYRAYFKLDTSPLKKLEVRKDDQWVETDRRRIQIDNQASQNWLAGVQVVPAVVYMADVRKKSQSLEQAMQIGVLSKDMDLGELASLGYQLQTNDKQTSLIGSRGQARIDTDSGLRFHMVFGTETEKQLIPLVIYAEANPNVLQAPPQKEELPAESKDWDEKKIKTEQDRLERRYQEARSQFLRMSEQLQQELQNANKRSARWIYFIPKEILEQLIPALRLSEEKPAAPENVESSASEESNTAPQTSAEEKPAENATETKTQVDNR